MPIARIPIQPFSCWTMTQWMNGGMGGCGRLMDEWKNWWTNVRWWTWNFNNSVSCASSSFISLTDGCGFIAGVTGNSATVGTREIGDFSWIFTTDRMENGKSIWKLKKSDSFWKHKGSSTFFTEYTIRSSQFGKWKNKRFVFHMLRELFARIHTVRFWDRCMAMNYYINHWSLLFWMGYLGYRISVCRATSLNCTIKK